MKNDNFILMLIINLIVVDFIAIIFLHNSSIGRIISGVLCYSLIVTLTTLIISKLVFKFSSMVKSFFIVLSICFISAYIAIFYPFLYIYVSEDYGQLLSGMILSVYITIIFSVIWVPLSIINFCILYKAKS